MVDPVLALILVIAAGATAVLLFWPVHGLFWRGLRMVRATDRVRIEDALKHLYDCEYRHSAGTLHSLAGALELSGNRTTELVSRIEDRELVTTAGGEYRLSPEGRRYALRIIRVHRLWERHLSDETGLGPAEWHAEADLREHEISQEEADALAARMGEPRYDPHGDPIPTADGDVPLPRGVPLTELAAGEVAEIVHVEDEPDAIYAQLLAAGLHPGMRVRMSEISPRRLRFEADADEHVLAPVLAANLTVVPLVDEPQPEIASARLSGLDPGDRATVTGFSAVCRGLERRRMLDLGIIPGTLVKAEMRSPGGDPTAYRVRGAVIALRREQADMIHIDHLAGLGDRQEATAP
ncbi:MAG: DNA-binding protein [bacterium]|nr:DNA-binding protein [bacterium]